MPFSDITTITTAPQRTDDPETFAALADPYVVSMRQFSIDMGVFKTELETAAALIDAAPAYADAGLVSIAGLTIAADQMLYGTATDTFAATGLTAFARTILDDVDAAAVRTTLGLGTMATQAVSAVAITGGSIAGITDLAVADGGTGASTATTARSNLSAAKSGANSDITSLTALSTALSVAQGGTGGTTLVALLTSLGFAVSGGATAGSVEIPLGSGDTFKFQWKDQSVAAGGPYTHTYYSAFSSWSRAMCASNAGDAGASQVYVNSGSFSTTGCTLDNEGSTTTAVIVAWGI